MKTSKTIQLIALGLFGLSSILVTDARAVTIDGYEVTVFAGGGDGLDGTQAQQAKLVVPFGIALDRAENLYIAEFDGGRIRRVDTQGVLSTISGDGSNGYKGDGGPAKQATFNGLHMHVVTPDGDIYVADTHNHCVRKIDNKTGKTTTVAGTGDKGFSGDGGPALKATFSGIFCNAMNPDRTKMYLADLGNRRIRVVDLKSGLVDTVAGNGKKGVPEDGATAAESPLVDPRAVAADRHGNVYILERGGHALRVVSPEGEIRTLAGTGKKGAQNGPGNQATLNGPKHLCIDLDDNVIIADAENRLIRKYDVETKQVTTLLSAAPGPKPDAKPIPLGRPHGVYVHTDGSLYIADSYNHRILKATKR